jgi:hypothetical protein
MAPISCLRVDGRQQIREQKANSRHESREQTANKRAGSRQCVYSVVCCCMAPIVTLV